jgi:hypothetical protein
MEHTSLIPLSFDYGNPFISIFLFSLFSLCHLGKASCLLLLAFPEAFFILSLFPFFSYVFFINGVASRVGFYVHIMHLEIGVGENTFIPHYIQETAKGINIRSG